MLADVLIYEFELTRFHIGDQTRESNAQIVCDLLKTLENRFHKLYRKLILYCAQRLAASKILKPNIHVILFLALYCAQRLAASKILKLRIINRFASVKACAQS